MQLKKKSFKLLKDEKIISLVLYYKLPGCFFFLDNRYLARPWDRTVLLCFSLSKTKIWQNHDQPPKLSSLPNPSKNHLMGKKTETLMSYLAIWIYSAGGFDPHPQENLMIWDKDNSLLKNNHTPGRIDFLPSTARNKITEGGRKKTTTAKQKKLVQKKNQHLSFHGSSLSYVHVGRSDPRSLSRHPTAPAGPLPESTTSGTSSCAFLHGFVLQGAVNDGHAVSRLNSVRFIHNRQRCC